MLADKILIVELLAVDGFAARTLFRKQVSNHQLSDPQILFCLAAVNQFMTVWTYVTPREIATLEHESRNNSMEAATLIAKPFLARAKSAEILSSLWHNVSVELENDSSRWACAGQVIRAELI